MAKIFFGLLLSGVTGLAEQVAEDAAAFSADFLQIAQTYSPFEYPAGIQSMILILNMWAIAFLLSWLVKEVAHLLRQRR